MIKPCINASLKSSRQHLIAINLTISKGDFYVILIPLERVGEVSKEMLSLLLLDINLQKFYIKCNYRLYIWMLLLIGYLLKNNKRMKFDFV